MAEYITKIDGSHSLPEIELAIQGEEATGAEFQRSAIAFHDGVITNLVTFKDLAPGQRPSKPLALLQQNAPAPGDKSFVWSGVMLVSTSNMAIAAYR